MRLRRRTAARRLCRMLVPASAAGAAIAVTAGPVAGAGIAPLCTAMFGLFDATRHERRRRPRMARATAHLSGLVACGGTLFWTACSAWSVPPVALTLPVVAGTVIVLGGLSGKPSQSAIAAAILIAASAVALV